MGKAFVHNLHIYNQDTDKGSVQGKFYNIKFNAMHWLIRRPLNNNWFDSLQTNLPLQIYNRYLLTKCQVFLDCL